MKLYRTIKILTMTHQFATYQLQSGTEIDWSVRHDIPGDGTAASNYWNTFGSL